jgi:signal transduction histidine kinase
MSEGVVVANTEGKMLFFNQATERISGIGASKESSENWTKEYGVFYEDGVTPYPADQNPIVRALRGEEPNNVVQFLKNPKIPYGVYVSVNGRPIRDAQGRIQGGVVVVRNISDQRRVEEKLKEYTRALETSNKELQDFVFVASHDLQEPLRKIQSFGEFLYDEFKGTLGETGRDYLERMRGAAGRMQTLINDLLALTRVTTKAQPFVSADLSQILKEVLADLEIRVEEKKAKVEVGPLPTLEADATQMRQLFQNLIANALKFQKNGTPPFVKVGFDNKYGEQIFKVFERLHGRDEYEGTGIGLAICRKVVERHGGTIMAEGVVGKGSTFTITLPFQQKK